MNSGIAVDRAFFGLTEDGGLAMEMFLIERMASCGDCSSSCCCAASNAAASSFTNPFVNWLR